MNPAKVTLIAAMAANRVIGIDNQLPWHLPEDLQHFKALTLGKPIVMGRKTFESIGRPLPGRRNIVISRQADWQHDGVERVDSIESALALTTEAAEICVIGGATVYEQTIALADCLQLTEIDLQRAGDAYFPDFSQQNWQQTAREQHISQDGIRYAFVEYRRRGC